MRVYVCACVCVCGADSGARRLAGGRAEHEASLRQLYIYAPRRSATATGIGSARASTCNIYVTQQCASDHNAAKTERTPERERESEAYRESDRECAGK